jgi:hypothetical protein
VVLPSSGEGWFWVCCGAGSGGGCTFVLWRQPSRDRVSRVMVRRVVIFILLFSCLLVNCVRCPR